jgi:hypothetical protein
VRINLLNSPGKEVGCVAKIEENITNHTPASESSLSKQKDCQWLFFVAILAFLGVLGAPMDLECRRVEPRGPVNCVKQTQVLWIIPLPEQRIEDVRGAHLDVIPGDEYCDPCYRVELLTVQGVVPLSFAYTSGSHDKSIVVDKVNDFVRNGTLETLTVAEPGLLSFENVACFLAWFLVVTGGSYLWRKIRSALGRA